MLQGIWTYVPISLSLLQFNRTLPDTDAKKNCPRRQDQPSSQLQHRPQQNRIRSESTHQGSAAPAAAPAPAPAHVRRLAGSGSVGASCGRRAGAAAAGRGGGSSNVPSSPPTDRRLIRHQVQRSRLAICNWRAWRTNDALSRLPGRRGLKLGGMGRCPPRAED